MGFLTDFYDWFKWVNTNRILLSAIIPFVGAIILPFINQFSNLSITLSAATMLTSMVVYQYYSCNIKIENIMKKRIESALELLSTRLAKGEISPEEYEKRKSALMKSN
jgi:uncharacterized membrane protein